MTSTATLAGRTVHRIGYGAMQLERLHTDREAAIALLRHAFDRGVDHVDTAQFYGDGFVNGVLRDVKNLGRSRHAHERVFALLGWASGQFEFFPLPPGSEIEGGQIEPTSVTYLLMEHARREDEAAEQRRRS